MEGKFKICNQKSKIDGILLLKKNLIVGLYIYFR